ncbi:AAA family ATPase [Nakamurella endophytica]|uniref:AAA family ATPase n=1 Tax=Nakamurella endophytica TaxID=1748367 RepID=UPI00166E660A
MAHDATGLLGTFNAAGVLQAADVHVATRLGELAGEPDDTVRLALALAVRGVREGSVCVDLSRLPATAPDLPWPPAEQWDATVTASPLVGPGRPLRRDLGLLYLDRYWRQEEQVHADLLAREDADPPELDRDRLQRSLDRLFDDRSGRQREAAAVAAHRWTTVLGGGPGTGKTTTVARLLAVLQDQVPAGRPALRIALAAPTGKAAARLQEAVQDAAAAMPAEDRARLGGLTASTLHRLLGFRPGTSTRFRHDRDNRLPHDVVVVDETSMLSLTMMARLLEALRPDARLVLVGDPDQLASVEAGAVLADLVAGLTAGSAPAGEASDDAAPAPPSDVPLSDVPLSDAAPPLSDVPLPLPLPLPGARPPHPAAPPPPAARSSAAAHGVVLLDHTWRFGGDIADVARAIRLGDADAALEVLRSGSGVVELVDPTDDADLRADVVTSAAAIREAAWAGDAPAALRRLDEHRLLCAHRSGPFGVATWSRLVERWIAEAHGVRHAGTWYVGRPLLVTANDYALGLYNGDTGVVVAAADGSLRAAFSRAGDVVTFAPGRLSDVQTVHAMTVHRSQGSQFRVVSVVLPPADSALSTREMIYTAVSRAQERVRLLGDEERFAAAIGRPAARASGLRRRLIRGLSGEETGAG